MATINVRQLDDGVVRRLKRRASLNNRSLEGDANSGERRRRSAGEARFLSGLVGPAAARDRRARAYTGGGADPRGSRPRPSRLLMRWSTSNQATLHAPRLMACEIANAVWRKARLGEIERSEAGAMMASVPGMPVRWNADETVCADAVRLALALDRPVYDCVYLALAHRIGAAVVTADLRFANALAPTEHGDAVVTLADHARTRS